MDSLEKKLTKIEHGFKPFEEEALEIIGQESLEDAKSIAIRLLKSEHYQLRCCAIFILGFIAAKDIQVLNQLKEVARSDQSWQVQEIVAKAFDQFCKDNGYEQSLLVIKEWLSDKHPNVCRAVTEGLRIWTSRPYFKTHPKVAIQLISLHKASESEYLRKSVGNALRDIRKRHDELISNETAQWNLNDKRIAFTYKHVLKG
ncbi:MAG: DNA alkylation repair protein [Sphingobacterium paramultivorum]